MKHQPSEVNARHFRAADTPALVRLHADAKRLHAIRESGGAAWVVCVDGKPTGYASVAPVPGLAGVMDLQGCVARAARRQGLGRHLLHHVLGELTDSEVRQLSHGVTSLQRPAAHFLRHHGFYLAHEEVEMVRERLDNLPSLVLPAGCVLLTFPRAEAIHHFQALYEQSFAGTPWYQPYGSAAEVAADLGRARDLLFVFCDGAPVGFIWTRLHPEDDGEIEPMGIAPTMRRRGLGRLLLLAGLHELHRRGARQVRLGLWRDNRAALRLYERLGFLQSGSLFYLAYDL